MQGGLPAEPLNSMTVDQVCNLLRRLEGLSVQQLPSYQTQLQDNNISGAVLSNCELSELRNVLRMSFGDWELFKNLVIVLRDRETYLDDESSTESFTHELDGAQQVETVLTVHDFEPTQQFKPVATAPAVAASPKKAATPVVFKEPQPRMKRIDSMAYEMEMTQGLLNQFLQVSGLEEKDESDTEVVDEHVVDMTQVNRDESRRQEAQQAMNASNNGAAKLFMAPDGSDSDSDIELQVIHRRGSRQSNRSRQNADSETLSRRTQDSAHSSQERLRTISRSDDIQGPSAFRNMTPASSRPPSGSSGN